MSLTRTEREQISDNRLKIQAVAESLKKIDPRKVPEFEEIATCLDQADESLSGALRSTAEEP
jgi:hypothetical protein